MFQLQSSFLSLNRVRYGTSIEQNALPNVYAKYACQVLEHCIPLFFGLLCCVSSTFHIVPPMVCSAGLDFLSVYVWCKEFPPKLFKLPLV